MKTNKIYVLACVHGNETFGLKVLEELKISNSNKIKLRIAHPKAVTAKKRCIQTDLNRSFMMGSSTSLEAKIAQDIKAEIERCQPDLVIDLHTSTAKVGKVAILCGKNPTLIRVAKQLGMERVAVMPKKITRLSAIGVLPNQSICIELGRGNRSTNLAKIIAANIERLTSNNTHHKHQTIPLYTIARIINHTDAGGMPLFNYVFSQELRGYPFLTGEKNYTEHRGFLATSQIEV